MVIVVFVKKQNSSDLLKVMSVALKISALNASIYIECVYYRYIDICGGGEV